MNNSPVYAFNHYIDLSGIKDSMQLDSGTVIATLETPNFYASLEVRGDVKVFWNASGGDPSYGECYRNPSEFCEGLKNLIKTNNDWYNDEKVFVSENNWFELFVGKDKNDPIPFSEVVDVEGLSSENLEKLILDYAQDEESYKTLNESETTLYEIPVEWTVGDTIQVEAVTLEKAIEWVRAHADEIPCSDDAEYICNTWKITGDEGQSANDLAKKLEKWMS